MNSARLDILPWRIELMRRADYSIADTASYIRASRLDPEAVEAFAGCMVLASVVFADDGRFAFADLGGEDAAIIEVLADTDGDRFTIDLAAWALADPSYVATATGWGKALGAFNVANPATWFAGRLMRAHRTPLGWLQDRCEGVCILDGSAARDVLSGALGPILAEDEGHARELKALTGRAARIAYPRPAMRRAA